MYNGHGDVVALVDATGTPVASYSYDSWGNLLSSSESFSNGWTNPYRYDGRDGARYDAATGLYWLAVRVYDPTLGRFLARDPLNRAPLFVSDNPYVYAGNNPLSNVDPSGQKVAGASAAQAKQAAKQQASAARVVAKPGTPKKQSVCKVCRAEGFAGGAGWWFTFFAGGFTLGAAAVGVLSAVLQTEAAADIASVIAAALGIAVEALVAQLGVLIAVLGAIAAVAGLLAAAFSWEATRPDSWWSSDQSFDRFTNLVMSGLRQIQTLALTVSALLSRVLTAAGAFATALKANFGLLGGVAIALIAVTAMEGKASSALQAEAGVFGWAFQG